MREMIGGPGLWIAIGAILVVAWLLRRLWRRRASMLDEGQAGDAIDLSELVASGPPKGPLGMEVYGTPVRLQLIVLAPLGRHSELPMNEQLPHILNNFVSGFTRLSSLHRPLVYRWPQQLSAQGFNHAFFNQVSLPGDHGRGTPWCAVCGRFAAAGGQYLIGMVFSSDKVNGLGEITVQQEGQWHDLLRIRESSE